VVADNGLVRSDQNSLRLFVEHRSAFVLDLAQNVTRLGDFPLLVVLAVVAAGLLWLKGARLALAVAPLASLAIGGALCAVGKQLVGRPRPSVALRLLPESDASFPSGHATDSTAFFVALALVVAIVLLRRPLARAAAVVAGAVLPGAIGISRLVLGVHWPTDVIAGWALGLLVALVVTTFAALVARVPPADGDAADGRVQRLARSGHRLAAMRRVSSALS
jgi:undecaprenyl-diphosphatase